MNTRAIKGVWLPSIQIYLVTEDGAALGLGSREYELVDVLPVATKSSPPPDRGWL